MKHLRKFGSEELMEQFVASYTFTKDEPMVLACEGSSSVGYSSDLILPIRTHLIYADGSDLWIDEITAWSDIPNLYDCIELTTNQKALPNDVYRSKYLILNKVSMPNVVSIGDYSFCRCRELTSIDLSNVRSIGRYALYWCGKITSVGDTSKLSIIDNNTFNSCRLLTSVDLCNVVSIGDFAFSSCESLSSLGDLTNIESIGREAFFNCTKITSVDLPNATNIDANAFQNCSALISANLPKVTLLYDGAFQNCSALTSVTLPSTPPIMKYTYGLKNTPCTFYIPRGSKQAYLEATNWSEFAESRFVEI